MKKFLKASTSIITAICMVAGLAVAIGSGIQADAADTYKNWTYATAGVTDGTASADTGYIAYDNEAQFELDGTKFSGYVDFNGLAAGMVTNTYDPSRLIFGYQNEGGLWGSKMIWFGVSKLAAQDGYGYLHCGVAGVGEWSIRDYAIQSGEEIFLQVAFDYIDSDNDNNQDDLQLHVWINGTQATRVVEAWGNWNDVTGEDICIKDYKDVTNPVYASVLFAVKSSMNGTVTYRSVHPVELSGIENNKTYCSGVEISLATAAADGLYGKDLDSVTVNGTKVTFAEGKYTIPAGTGATTVVVTDKMGETQTYNITVKADHTWGTELVSNNDATCMEDGTKSKQCTVCQTKDTQKVADEGSKLDHVYETYVSDGDATCAEDGHETALCKYNCGTTDTRVETGSATGNHTYGTDDKCTECGADKPVVPSQDGTTTGGTTTGGTTTGGTTTGGTTTGGTTDSVDTGDNNAIWTLVALMAVSVVAAAVVVLKRKELE